MSKCKYRINCWSIEEQNANFGCEAKTSSWPYSTLAIYPYRFSVNPWHLNSWYCIHMMGANHNLEEIKKCNTITVQIWVSSVQISNPNYFAQTQWCMCLTTLVVEIDKKCLKQFTIFDAACVALLYSELSFIALLELY